MNSPSIFDKAFLPYGRPVLDMPVEGLMAVLRQFPLPAEGMVYSPREDNLHAQLDFEPFGTALYADLPYQLGYCAGSNADAATLVRHGGSAFICGESDFDLMVCHRWEDAPARFTVPAGALVEIYGDTLRSAPLGSGFRVLAILPYATNTEWQGPAGVMARNTWRG